MLRRARTMSALVISEYRMARHIRRIHPGATASISRTVHVQACDFPRLRGPLLNIFPAPGTWSPHDQDSYASMLLSQSDSTQPQVQACDSPGFHAPLLHLLSGSDFSLVVPRFWHASTRSSFHYRHFRYPTHSSLLHATFFGGGLAFNSCKINRAFICPLIMLY